MKSLVLILSILIASITQSFAQDVLMFLDGNEEEVKITEVSSSEVKYKRMNNLEGPTFSTLKSELFMIKYANGDKDVIEHKAATQEVAPTPQPTPAPQPVQQEPVQTQSTLSQPTQTSSGLSSDVQVEEEPNQGYAKPQTDKYGRTRDENLRLHRKRVVGGAVTLGVGGGLFFFVGLPFGVTAIRLNEQSGEAPPGYIAAGVVGSLGGLVMIITGSGLLGSSRKYKQRASELANSKFQVNPILLNDFQYAGADIRNNSGAGIKLSYKF